MPGRVSCAGLKIDERLFNLVRDEITPGTKVDVQTFWFNFSAIVRDLGPTLNCSIIVISFSLRWMPIVSASELMAM